MSKRVLAIVAVIFLVGALAESADQILTRSDPRFKPARVPLALPDVGSDSCVGVPVIAGLPYADSGSTCGFANDIGSYTGTCTLASIPYPGPDVVYQMNLGGVNDVAFSMDVTASTGDLALFVLSACGNGTTCITNSQDSIGAGVGPELIASTTYGTGSGGTFYVYVDSYYAVGQAGSCGTYTLNATGTLPVELVEFTVE
ncbi:MAG: hypothetical protein HY825_08800 [Acidobacteria bacterium]|nr:hypothetical protein [Acidobacteriota bacterium]